MFAIRKAAARLNVASSAINRQILALEEEMGAPLFERLPRGLRLTAAGELCIEHIREVLKNYERLEGRIRSLKMQQAGKVRIVMTHEDPGYFNWLDTQSFTHGFLRHSSVLSRTSPMLETKLVKANELAGHLPAETRRISPAERLREMQRRFDAIRRRYKL